MPCRSTALPQGELEILTDEWSFVEHVLLHECAHAINHEFSEHQCDSWAFDIMREIGH